jgi:hypothetical protein
MRWQTIDPPVTGAAPSPPSLSMMRIAQFPAVAVQFPGEPPHVGRRRPAQPESVALEYRHGHRHYLAALHVQFGQVHDPQVVPEPLVAADPLVVVDEVPAAVEDQLAAVDLDSARMVRRVAVHQVDTRTVDQVVREPPNPLGDAVTPVAAPVNRDDHRVAGASQRGHPSPAGAECPETATSTRSPGRHTVPI